MLSQKGITSQNQDLIDLARHHRVLTAASLSRIFQHIKDNDSFGMITAFKADLSWKENSARQTQLGKEIRAMGYGFIRVEGHYTYTRKDEEGNDINAVESTAFVIGITLPEITALATRYEQESVVWGEKLEGEDGNVGIYAASGAQETKFNEVTTQNIEKVFSKFKKRKFKFSHLEFLPTGYISGLSWLCAVKHSLVASLGEDVVDHELDDMAMARVIAKKVS
jgi:hypothetical protein